MSGPSGGGRHGAGRHGAAAGPARDASPSADTSQVETGDATTLPPASASRAILELGFDLVRSEDFGASPTPSLIAMDGFVAACLPSAWRARNGPSPGDPEHDGPRHLVMSRAGPTLRAERTLETLESWGSFTRHVTAPVMLLSDMRLLRTDPEQQPLLLRRAVEMRPSLEATFEEAANATAIEIVMLTAPDWTRYFWGGLLAMMPYPTTVTDDEDVAWRAAGASADERARLDRGLDLALDGVSTLREKVATTLAQQPGLALVEVARSLGVSARTLQRSLADEATTFASLRDAARWQVAERLLSAGEKTTAIARVLGFASASHFAVWHKQKTGRTPRRGRAQTEGDPSGSD